jgi:hypothetical protein
MDDNANQVLLGIILAVTIVQSVLQVFKMIKKSSCGCCELQMREDPPNSNNNELPSNIPLPNNVPLPNMSNNV